MSLGGRGMTGPPVGAVLVVRRGGLGDTLLCRPLLGALRRRHPGARITLAGVRESADVLAWCGDADAAWSSEALGLWALGLEGPQAEAAQARLRRFDRILGDAPELAGVRPHPGRVTVFRPLPPPGGPHAADWLLQEAGLEPVPVSLPARARRPCAAGPILLHPGAGGRHKRWPEPHWCDLAAALHSLGHPLLVAAGPAEERDDPRAWAWPVPVTPLPVGSPVELGQALLGCRALVGHDSGPAHLAALLGVPTVALFGPTDPAQWAPRGPAVAVLGGGGSGPPAMPVADVVAALATLLGGSA